MKTATIAVDIFCKTRHNCLCNPFNTESCYTGRGEKHILQ